MNISQIYIVVSVVVLAIIAVLVFFIGRRRYENRLTPLASLAFAFIVAGILSGEDRIIGYGLMGVGVVLAVIDIINRSRSK
jgi:uncharacterized membrane protein